VILCRFMSLWAHTRPEDLISSSRSFDLDFRRMWFGVEKIDEFYGHFYDRFYDQFYDQNRRKFRHALAAAQTEPMNGTCISWRQRDGQR
jgi:hypothetical protein